MNIDQEKAIEYQQVAAMVCLMIDELEGFAHSDLSHETLKEMILQYAHDKKLIITNSEHRQSRYRLLQSIFYSNVEVTDLPEQK